MIIHPPPLPPLCPRARFTVALPLAIPTPRPRTPLERNIGAFLHKHVVSKHPCCSSQRQGHGSEGSEVFGLPQHVRHNKESHVASSDIHLIQMTDSPITSGYRDIFELDVHVVLGCNTVEKRSAQKASSHRRT